MSRDMPIYQGWSSTTAIRPGDNQKVDLDLALSGLHNAFNTHRGDMPMLPDFGTDLYLRLYEPITNQQVSEIDREIRRVIQQDPRFTIHTIEIERPVEFKGFYATVTMSFDGIEQPVNLFLDFSEQIEQRLI